MSPAEQNYNIYKKELMAIVKALKHWKIYLQGAKYPVIIHTDHMNLRTFTTTKVLDNRRLARWAEELASFDLVIKYVQGKDNARADALSRMPGYENDKVYEDTALLRQLDNGDMVPVVREAAILETEISQPWLERLQKAQTECKGAMTWATEPVIKDRLMRINGKVWLPPTVAEEYIREQHGLPAHGHQGIRRTYLRISRQY